MTLPEGSLEGNTRVLVADDHAVFRFGMRAMLANAHGFEVVAEASTGEDVVGKAAEVRPDIVLMDIQMPGMNGIEATRKIAQANPEVSVVVVTMFGDDDSVFAAMRGGTRIRLERRRRRRGDEGLACGGRWRGLLRPRDRQENYGLLLLS